MLYGMTYEQFWDGDIAAAPAYRKAYEMRVKQESELLNLRAWLHGLYTYDAICCTAPILRALSKAKKPAPYPKEPYPLNGSENKEEQTDGNRKETPEEREQRIADAKFHAYMMAWMHEVNKNFERKEESDDGGESADSGAGI